MARGRLLTSISATATTGSGLMAIPTATGRAAPIAAPMGTSVADTAALPRYRSRRAPARGILTDRRLPDQCVRSGTLDPSTPEAIIHPNSGTSTVSHETAPSVSWASQAARDVHLAVALSYVPDGA
ncbi:hypothetical protein GCM10023216_18640 [Isoptericola chiayiensis]|uniref:Secreted protein n=1 Tax=Isoptericola chiayiensis TaxID=579446 RepID=A0ABP8YGH6_9MICO